MKILELIIYSKDGRKRRILEFNKDGVTIISGRDKTGKTAILEIIQYCLGSEDCRVPEGVIRDNVSWYGIRLQFETEQMFIARKNPDQGKQTTNQAVYVLKKEIIIPETAPEDATTNIDDIVQILTIKVGIRENLFRPELEHTRNSFETTLKHTLFYCFQDQNDIGTKKYLFHKQAEEWMPQAMRDTLPYIMGAVEQDRLQNENELTTKKRELSKIKKKIREAELINSNSFAQAQQLVDSAYNLGLIKLEDKRLESVDEYKTVLNNALNWRPDVIQTPNYDEINNGLYKIEQLEKEKRNINEKIAAMQAFIITGESYCDELEIQKNRLESIGIYKKLCKSTGVAEYNIPYLEQMQESLSKLHVELDNVQREVPRVIKSIEKLKDKKDSLNAEIEYYQSKVDALYEQEDIANRYKELNMQRGIIIGKIMLWLESSRKLDNSSSEQYQLNQVEQDVSRLERLLEMQGVEDKTASIINRMGKDITEFAQRLALEHSNNPIRFDLKALTVVADRPDKPISLEKMGGAANWVGYHLAIHFALHKHFIEAKCPTPRFVFLDQPSYAYFPEALKSKEDLSEESLELEDRTKIEQVYDFIFNVSDELKGNLQIILTDHVILNNNTFKKKLKEVWRKGNANEALVPSEWYQ